MAKQKLKVVQMLPALESGGVERGTLEVASELVRRGHDSIVVSAGGRLVSDLVENGSRHFDWDVGAKRLGTLKWIGRMRKLLMDEEPDILHLRSRLPAWIGYLAWRGLKPQQRPHLVTTVHGPYSVNRYSAIMTRGEKVIAVSNSIRSYILNNYPETDPDRIQVIHRGVDREVFSYGYRPDQAWLDEWYRQYPETRDRYLVTLPARITRWKGHEDFVRIIEAVKQAGIPVHGLIVGDAHPKRMEFERELRQQVSDAGLDDDISFTGFRKDIREIMSISDMVLSLSLYEEAFGRTTLEALSLGIPVVGYSHGGVAEQLSEIFPDGEVAVGEPNQVAEKLVSLYSNRPVIKQEHNFTLQKMLADTLGVYSSLAKA
jgi:glycosyltransferase involved in cell wall biosynthesis